MKMKKLLLVVLTLAILTSLSAGTLAVYTKTNLETAQVEAKRFAFSTSGDIKGDAKTINLAPTEQMEYDFTIANVDAKGGPVAEVPLEYNVTIDYASAFSAMPGLKAVLFDGNKEVGTYTNGKINFTTSSEADKLFDQTYRVELKWEDDGSSNAGHTKAGSNKVTFTNGLNVTISATQITTK